MEYKKKQQITPKDKWNIFLKTTTQKTKRYKQKGGEKN
jgi:hypothetical protein